MTPAALSLTLLVTLPAFAAPATDPGPSAQRLIAASPQQLSALLDDPVFATGLLPDVLEVTVSPSTQAGCTLLDVHTRGLWRPLHYQNLRCPTGMGWTQELAASEDFEDFRSEWSLIPTEGGTLVTLWMRVDPNLPVPQRLIDEGTRRTVHLALQSLAEAGEPPPISESPAGE